jgi:hypothetical protein
VLDSVVGAEVGDGGGAWTFEPLLLQAPMYRAVKITRAVAVKRVTFRIFAS